MTSKNGRVPPLSRTPTRDMPFTKFVHFWLFKANPRARGKACKTTRKVLGPPRIFQLPARTDEDRRCIRRFICLDFARLTRIYGMLASSAFLGEHCTNSIHDISRVGVRLSGGARTFLDVTQPMRCPSRGEDRGENTRRTLPTFWPASRVIWL